jgi:hypothetical protein
MTPQENQPEGKASSPLEKLSDIFFPHNNQTIFHFSLASTASTEIYTGVFSIFRLASIVE